MASGESSLESNVSGGGPHDFSSYPNDRSRSPGEFDSIKQQYDQAVIDLGTLRRQHSDSKRRCDHVVEQLEYYRGQYMAAMNQLETSAQEISTMRNKFGDMSAEKTRLQQKVGHLEKKLGRIIESMKLENGNNQTVCAFLEQYNELKKKYENSCTETDKQNKEVEMCKKLCVELTEDRNSLALEKDELKQQLTNALKQYDTAQRERSVYREARDTIIKEHDEQMKEINKVLEARAKEIKRSSDQRNAAEQEVILLLSERDTVLKENQKLTDDLALVVKKSTAQENRLKEERDALLFANEAMKRDAEAARRHRDDILKECDILREKVEETSKSRPDFGAVASDAWAKELGDAQDSEEIERLKKALDRARAEAVRATQETDVAKGRRDWAISEREKIVQERDSVKILCDELRKERDSAISKLLATIRDSENIKKQKDEACNEIDQLREHLESQLMTSSSGPPPVPSRWSCAPHDTDVFAKGDTEIIELDLMALPSDGELGLILEGGRDDTRDVSGEQGIYVVGIAKDSVVDGKLRLNDCIVQVNNLDCTAASKRIVLETIRLSAPRCKVVVRRKNAVRPHTRHLYSAQLNVLNNRNHGLALESGIYITKVTPGSLAAKDGGFAVGDRVLSINSRSMEGVSNAAEAMAHLDDNRTDVLTVIALKQATGSGGGRSYNRAVNTCTQTEDPSAFRMIVDLDASRHFAPVASPATFMPTASPLTSSAAPSKSISIISEMFQKFRGKIHSGSHKYSTESGSGGHGAGGGEENDAIAVLDSVLDGSVGDAPTKDVLKRSKRKSKEAAAAKEAANKNLGTWPRANTIAHENPTGTIVQHRKKERPALSLFTSANTEKDDENYFHQRGSKVPTMGTSSIGGGNTSGPGVLSLNTHRNSNPFPFHVLSPPPSIVNRHSVYKAHESDIGLTKPPPLPVTSSTLSRNTKLSEFDSHYHQHLHHHHHHHPHPSNRMSLNLTPSDSSLHYQTVKSPVSLDFKPVSQQQQQSSLDFISLKSQNSIDSFLGPKGLGASPARDREPIEFYAGRRAAPKSAVSKYPSDSESLGPDSLTASTTLPSYSRIQSLYTPSLRTNQGLFQSYGGNGVHSHGGMRHASPLTIPAPPLGIPSNDGSFSSTYAPPFHHSHGVSIDYVFAARTARQQGGKDDLPACGYEGGTFPRKKENQRFRIPSNPSVTSKGSGVKNSTGSIEHHGSERGSPMPTFQVEVLSHGTNVAAMHKRNSMPDYVFGQKPNPGDLRRVTINKSIEPLGITIRCNDNGGGIFVSTVTKNSIASQVGLQIGDQLLEVCGINMRCATYELAASVLRQCGNPLTILVQYSPEMYSPLPEYDGDMLNTSEEENISRSGSPTPRNSPRNVRAPLPQPPLPKKTAPLINSNVTQSMVQKMERTPLASENGSTSGTRLYEEEPRVLFIETNKSSNLGVRLLGGNAVGIFVHSVQPDSLADHAGMRLGDQILEYNGSDLRRATAEHAAYELAKPADKVTVIVQYNIQKFNQIKDKPGDSLYIRVGFDRTGDLGDSELKFVKEDVLYVDNTMFRGVPGSWRAWKLDELGGRMECGIIPSQLKVEEELRLLGDITDGDGTTRRGSTTARRSFFRRKKHQRSSSRDSKELASFSNTQLSWFSDSGMLNDEGTIASYQRVERLDYPVFRPVLVLGPLSDCVADKLTIDFPGQFQRCPITSMNCSQELVEKGIQNNHIVDYRRRGNTFECTSVQAIRDICNKDRHGIMDVCISAIERLQRLQIYPIVLLLRFRSAKQIKEVKDARYSTDKISAKAAKEMYEHSLKLESDYKQFISAVVPASRNITHMSTQIKAAVDDEQKKTLWVPSTTTP